MSANANPDQHAAKLAQIIRSGLEEMKTPAYADKLRFFAMDAFARYKSFVAAGFTAEQALALTIAKL